MAEILIFDLPICLSGTGQIATFSRLGTRGRAGAGEHPGVCFAPRGRRPRPLAIPFKATALLLRLRVKRLGGFHLFDQLVGGLNRPGVYQLLHHLFQKANPPIDFDAFITHAAIAFARVSCPNPI